MGRLKIAGRILYSFEAKRLLSELLDRYEVDIAHLHNIHHHISPSILHELKKRKIPVVMTLHDYKMVCASYTMFAAGKPCEACKEGRYIETLIKKCVKDSIPKSVLSALEMYLHHKALDIYGNVDIFISPSLFLKNKLKEMGFKKTVVHVPNFVEMQQAANGQKIFLKEPDSIVYFGRLSPEKGLWTLLDAAKFLTNEIKNKKIEIKIIGDGPIKDKLQEKAKVEGINNVRFFGYMKGEALYQEVKKCTAVVLPSEWYENNPMSVIESFALGKPVIGAKIGGIPEMVRDNETGLTFEPGNPSDLCRAIQYFINHPDKAIEMGENARKFVAQELNAEQYYEKLMKLYRQVISKVHTN